MKVFVSSVIEGFEEFRDAAANGARVLRHHVLRAEDFWAISMSNHDDRVVMLSPPVHSRATLRVRAGLLAEDLMVPLRRQVQS